jgi:predicted RNase H-like HicB family nuclease
VNIEAFQIQPVGRSGATRDLFPLLPYASASARTMTIRPVRPPSETLHLFPVMPGWNFKQPLRVVVELDDDGTYIVSDDVFAQYGQGETSEEAISDYVSSLAEYLELLELRAKDHKPTARLFGRYHAFVSRSKNALRPS